MFLGVLVVLGLVKVCWRCSITSGRRNCSVLGMPKCWKVGAGTFWSGCSEVVSLFITSICQAWVLCTPVPLLTCWGRFSTQYQTQILHILPKLMGQELECHIVEPLGVLYPLNRALASANSLKRGVNGTCAVAHLYLIQVIIHRANALSWDDPRSSNTVLDQVNSSKVHCYIGQTVGQA